MISSPHNTALILIDIQKGFDDVDYWSAGRGRNNLEMEANARKLLDYARQNKWQIAHIQHASTEENSPLRQGGEGFEFKTGFEVMEGELHFVKSVNSAFIGTDLEKSLRAGQVKTLVICGISTEHCVSTTTRMAANLGFEVILVCDACHAWPHGNLSAEEIHNAEITILEGEFAKIVTLSELIL